jgi:hypothetical protein
VSGRHLGAATFCSRSTGQGLATGAATCGNVHAAVVDVCGRSSSRMRRCSACCCQHHPASARSRRHVRFGVALSQCGTGSYNGAASGMRTAEKVLGHAGFVLSMLATPPLCCPQSRPLTVAKTRPKRVFLRCRGACAAACTRFWKLVKPQSLGPDEPQMNLDNLSRSSGFELQCLVGT